MTPQKAEESYKIRCNKEIELSKQFADIICLFPNPISPQLILRWWLSKRARSGRLRSCITQAPTHSLACSMHASKGDECKNAGVDGWVQRWKCWREYRANIHLSPFCAKWTASSLPLLLPHMRGIHSVVRVRSEISSFTSIYHLTCGRKRGKNMGDARNRLPTNDD